MNPLRFALLSITALLAAAQQAPQATPQPSDPASAKPPEKCTIEGDVANAITGEPVKKAQIRMSSVDVHSRAYGAVSDAAGHFVLQDIEPGPYRLDASRNGFAQAQYGARNPGQPGTLLSLNSGQRSRDIVFRLLPHAVITGRVLDEDGEPVERVQVAVLRYSYRRGKRELLPAGNGMTDDLGEYRIFGLIPGRYYLSATYRQQNLTNAQDRTPDAGAADGYAATYYAGTSDPAGAAPIELAAGAQLRGIDVTLLKTRTVRVRGRVVNTMADRPPRNVRIMVTPRDSMFWGAVRIAAVVRDPQGAFELRGVTPGSYVLMAQWSDEGKGYMARQALDVGANGADNIMVALTAGLDLKGQVHIDGSAQADLGSIYVQLQPRGSFPMGTPSSKVKEDGSFLLPAVGTDTYAVQVTLPPPLYVKSIRMGDVDATETELDLTRGAGGELDIVLGANGGQVDGSVMDSKQQPAKQATIALVPDARHRDLARLFKSANTDAFGHFTIKGVAPGDYKLFAFEDVESGAYQDAEFLKPLENLGEAVSIREGSHENAQLKLIPAEHAGAQKHAGT